MHRAPANDPDRSMPHTPTARATAPNGDAANVVTPTLVFSAVSAAATVDEYAGPLLASLSRNDATFWRWAGSAGPVGRRYSGCSDSCEDVAANSRSPTPHSRNRDNT